MKENNRDEQVYIHYGHKEYDKYVFCRIKNRMFPKPTGGLWACRIETNDWIKWCKNENFYLGKYSEDNCFKFKLKMGSRILTIDSVDSLKTLPKISSEFGFIILDFEKISKEYDAIELLISSDHELYYELYSWDIDSILILNRNCIMPL